MIQQAFDRQTLQQYVGAVRENLDAPELHQEVVRAADAVDGGSDPAATLRSKMPDVTDKLASSGGRQTVAVPYLSRDPIHSLLQSTLDEKLRDQGVEDRTPHDRGIWGTIVHTAEQILHAQRFGPTDPDWVIDVGRSMLDRLAAGNHAFNRTPARHEISDAARIVVVGDWGTGLPRAKAVAGFMAEEIAGALKEG
ncbi:MAG: hypothetical protein ACTHQQ_07210, partial [Solirubrobacteraceae bacterium]